MYASNRCAFQRLQYVTSNNIDKWDSFRALNEKQIRSNNIKHIFNALWSLCLFVSTGAELGQCLTQFSGRQASSNSIPPLSVQISVLRMLRRCLATLAAKDWAQLVAMALQWLQRRSLKHQRLMHMCSACFTQHKMKSKTCSFPCTAKDYP